MGDDHQDTSRVVQQLADLYAASGQPGKAEEWRAKLQR
jgi:hypothetical protein